MPPKQSRLIDGTFFITILGKGVGGLGEFITGIALIFFSVSQLQHLLTPLQHIGFNLVGEIDSGTRLFIICYFSARGFFRMMLAVTLLQERLWAYPVTLVFLGGTIVYQVYLLISGHFSFGLVGLTMLDGLVVGLTVHEYRKLKAGGHLAVPHLKSHGDGA